MPGWPTSINAFSPEYLTALRASDEPPDSGPDDPGPLVIREGPEGFGLFRPWQSFEAGDAPEAFFGDREDARLFLAAWSVLRRARVYRIEEAAEEEETAAGRFVVAKAGEPAGRMRTFQPDWVFAAQVLAAAARSAEDLAAVMAAAGPSGQEEVGEILGRELFAGRAATGGSGGDEGRTPG